MLEASDAPRRQNRERTIRRKILFYRVNVGADTSGKLKHFDPGVLAPLGSLSFDEQSGRYFIEPDGNALCLWIDSQAPRLQLRFGRIRRTDLPLIEQHGKLTELRIDDDAGLSEPIHLIFFDNVINSGKQNPEMGFKSPPSRGRNQACSSFCDFLIDFGR
jgi:hypothetical protein